MKLKSLAALIFRILGTLFILSGMAETIDLVLPPHNIGALVGGFSSLILGYCFLRYSKKLAAVFCKGLDDDSF